MTFAVDPCISSFRHVTFIDFNLSIFLKYVFKNDKNLIIYITENNLYYLSLHLKLSSIFYSTQLIDIFCYELPTNINKSLNNQSTISTLNNTILIYNFHSIASQQRFFIFAVNSIKKNINKRNIASSSLNSITELFLNAN